MNILLIDFLNDMVDVGLKKWMSMALGFGILTWAFWGTNTWAMLFGVIMTANLLGASIITKWWEIKLESGEGYYGAS